MRKITVFPFLILFTSILMGQKTVWFRGSYEQALIDAKKEGKNLLILFSCGDG